MSRLQDGKDASDESIRDALYFFQRQSESDSRELNTLRKKLERMTLAGNTLAAYCSSSRAIGAWLDAVADRHDEREMGS